MGRGGQLSLSQVTRSPYCCVLAAKSLILRPAGAQGFAFLTASQVMPVMLARDSIAEAAGRQHAFPAHCGPHTCSPFASNPPPLPRAL